MVGGGYTSRRGFEFPMGLHPDLCLILAGEHVLGSQDRELEVRVSAMRRVIGAPSSEAFVGTAVEAVF